MIKIRSLFIVSCKRDMVIVYLLNFAYDGAERPVVMTESFFCCSDLLRRVFCTLTIQPTAVRPVTKNWLMIYFESDRLKVNFALKETSKKNLTPPESGYWIFNIQMNNSEIECACGHSFEIRYRPKWASSSDILPYTETVSEFLAKKRGQDFSNINL